MCNVSSYHRTHPVTGYEFDYNHTCKACAHFSVVTRRKVKVVRCALAPEKDGETFDGQVREAFPACEAFQMVMTPVRRRTRGR